MRPSWRVLGPILTWWGLPKEGKWCPREPEPRRPQGPGPGSLFFCVTALVPNSYLARNTSSPGASGGALAGGAWILLGRLHPLFTLGHTALRLDTAVGHAHSPRSRSREFPAEPAEGREATGHRAGCSSLSCLIPGPGPWALQDLTHGTAV